MTLKDRAAQFGIGDEGLPRLTALSDQVGAACEQLLTYAATMLDALYHDDREAIQRTATEGTQWLNALSTEVLQSCAIQVAYMVAAPHVAELHAE